MLFRSRVPDDGDVFWPSPWGEGRPGWHIECVAIALDHLGMTIDVQGGGSDLAFPHHEMGASEAQVVTGDWPYARHYVHAGMVGWQGHKMSKSLGNFFTIEQLLSQRDFGGRKWHGSVLRLAMLTSHYRQPIDWTIKSLEESWRALESFFNSAGAAYDGHAMISASVRDALMDDLNTPNAIAELHALDKPGRQNELGETLKALGFTGKLSSPKAEDAVDEGAVNALITARLDARKAKNWGEVWLKTPSRTVRMPRAFIACVRSANSRFVPNSGSTLK